MIRKSAFITGGASGMGLAVAQALDQRGEWDMHILDLNEAAGKSALSSLKNAHFHKTNVTSYSSLVEAYESAFKTSGRIDFVFANAGIVERDNFYEKYDLEKAPPEPNQLSIDINFKAVVNTSYLALHYFRKTRAANVEGYDPALVMTASCGGLYPSEFCPMYSGSKAAVIQFNKAISYCYHLDGIRTYATCPGTIRTNLMSGEEWKSFPERYFTPIETLVTAVVKIVEGGDLEDSKGKKFSKEDAWGLTVEVNRGNYYFRAPNVFCDQEMEDMMKFTSMGNQLARIEKTKLKSGEKA